MSEDKVPPEDQTIWTAESESETIRQIGPYRLLQKVGQGGMGEVWLAEQQEPIRRRVALKLIKLGMDTKQVLARFEAERQALALMDHPNIARVFDAGASEQGRPYFAMEHVKGVPITEYCDKNRLKTAERLRLFTGVCDGVQHAHQKGILHRDIKPSNVLVALQGDVAVPKIIDFGVAKATAQRLTERTLSTEIGQIIGTPEYMSPEQAEMTGLDVDTRTDVYSLGVLLYELLCGALPIDSKDLRRVGFHKFLRRIVEDEPETPSSRVSSLGDASNATAARRRADPGMLSRQLRGDLDWITMKALEKDRTRRYGSPQELAADIQRHLTDEPVLACPPSAAYRAGKFVRRHRVGAGVAALAVLFLLVLSVTMTLQAARIAQERDRANAEAERANREADAKGQVSQFLKDLFKVSDPSEARGNSITARELLDKGAKEIDEALAEQPEARAELMSTMGEVYKNLGLYSAAEPLLAQALETLTDVYGRDHPTTLDSMNGMTSLYHDQGRYEEAELLARETVETAKRVLGPDHRDTLEFKNNLATTYFYLGRFREAEPLFRDILEHRKHQLGEDHAETLHSMSNLAILIQGRRNEEAEQLFVDVLEKQKRVLGEDHPDTLNSMENLATLYGATGRHDEAERLLLETLAIKRRVLGEDHPDTAAAMHNLAVEYFNLGRFDDLEPLILETLEIKKRALGQDHPDTLLSLSALALLYSNQGRYDEAEPLHLETLATQKRVLGHDHPETVASMYALGCLENLRGDPAAAMEWLRQAVDAGLARAEWMAKDSDLESLHGPEFDALMERARQNATQL